MVPLSITLFVSLFLHVVLMHSFQPFFGVERNMANSSQRKAQIFVDDRHRLSIIAVLVHAARRYRSVEAAIDMNRHLSFPTRLLPLQTFACLHQHATAKLEKTSSDAKALLRCVQAMYPFCRCPSCPLQYFMYVFGSRRCEETRRHRNERLDTHAVAEVKFGNNYQAML